MSTYLTPDQFSAKHKITPQTLRCYIKRGMPCRKERYGKISYPEQECLDWISNHRKTETTPPRPLVASLENKGYITSVWLQKKCDISLSTICCWVTRYGAPAIRKDNSICSPGSPLYFHPMEFLTWFRLYERAKSGTKCHNTRTQILNILEKEIPEFITNHTTEQNHNTTPLITQALTTPSQQLEAPTKQTTTTEVTTNTTVTTMSAKPTTTRTTATDSLKPQHRKYDPCRTYQTGDEIQVTLCNGRTNGIATNLLLATGTVLKNENAVGIVLCSIAGNPEQIPASNLRLLRAVEDIPQYAILHTGHTLYITPKSEKEAIFYITHHPSSPLTLEKARTIAELALSEIKESETHTH